LTFHALETLRSPAVSATGQIEAGHRCSTEADIKEMSAKFTEKGNWFRGMQAAVSESWSGGRSLTFLTTR
jgi:hypothetical protein